MELFIVSIFKHGLNNTRYYLLIKMKLRRYFYVYVTKGFRTFISANMNVKIYLLNNLKFNCKYAKM